MLINMEVFTLIIFIIIIYLLYVLIDTISTLRNEIKEMKKKCIKNIYKDNKKIFEIEQPTDIKTDLMNKYNLFIGLFKKMI